MTDRIFGLDVLRAAAIVMVLVSHGRALLPIELEWTRHLSLFGLFGVELFFVLSGILIGGIILKTFPDTPTFGNVGTFWVRRWFRTLPNYYLFLGANVVASLLLDHGARGVPPYLLFLQNLTTCRLSFFGESWSLAVEEWFYLLLPLFLLLASRIRGSIVWYYPMALVALLAISTTARLVVAKDPNVPLIDIRGGVLFRLDSLMVGVAGAYIQRFYPRLWERLAVPGIPVGILCLALGAASYYDGGNSWLARTFMFNVVSLGYLAFVPAFSGWATQDGAIAGVVRRISLWSYSLYLCHVPIVRCLRYLSGNPRTPGEVPNRTAYLLWVTFFVVSIVVAAFTYRFFEKPTTALRDRLRPKRPRPSRPVGREASA